MTLGTKDRPLRVAVIGSGPSGFYAAEGLFGHDIEVNVDMFDRLPAPYGLVRYGVAPDHPKIKNVTKVYEKTAAREEVNFLGNVNIGEDLSIYELKKFYDAIIITTGAETDRKLPIEGIDLPGSYTATEFVGWYNGHPDFQDREFDLSGEHVVIVGQGNVAMDVARILCKTVDELKTTDITQRALDILGRSHVKEVHMFGRRGPVQAAFTPPELKEFMELQDCDVIVDPKDLDINEASKAMLEDREYAQRKKNFDLLTEISQRPLQNKSKKLFIHFNRSPISIHGRIRVMRVHFEINELVGEPGKQMAKGTREYEDYPCTTFFRSIGYRGVPVKGLPFHDQTGVIPNEGGRVIDSEQIFGGIYVAGWIKRGPSGIIGTNKACADETVKNLLEDLSSLQPCEHPSTQAVLDLLRKKEVRVVSFEDWKKIDAAEIERGAELGKPREKFTKIEGMLTAL